MRNQRQKPHVAALTALMLLFSGALSSCPLSTSQLQYTVHVQDRITGSDVSRATVTVFIAGGAAPVSDITEDRGFARIPIDNSYKGQPATLVVEATGYKRCTRDINLTKDNLPEAVLLEPANVPLDNSSPPEDTHEPTSTTAVPTATPEPVPTSAEPTPTPEPTPTDTSPPTSIPVPKDMAIAIESAGIFAAPDASSQLLGGVSEGEQVVVLGRSAYGEWFYIRDDQGVEGFVYAPRFDWSGDYESLPMRKSTVPLPNPSSTPTTAVSIRPLEMDLWQLPGTGRCEGVGWYMSVYIQGRGGDGVYTYYWNEQKLAGPLSGESYSFELFSIEGAIVGTGKVVSGDGQAAEKGLYIPAPDCAQ